MRDARRMAAWLAMLAIVVVAGDRAGAFVFSRILLHSQFRFSRVYRGGLQADVLVIGDSRGVHSFYAPAIERLTGRPAFNLSFNSMSMPIIEALLADYLDRNARPRRVVIETTCVTVHRGLFSELVTYAGASPRLERLYASEHPRAAAAARTFHLLPYNSEFFLRALASLRSSDQDWINRTVIPPELTAPRGSRWQPHAVSEDLDALERVVAMLKDRGVETRLVIAPYHPAARIGMEDLTASVTAHARRVDPSARVWNYSDALSESRYFADAVHLNADGSEVFLRMLVRDGVLTRAGEPAPAHGAAP
jgi:hypothetical protein